MGHTPEQWLGEQVRNLRTQFAWSQERVARDMTARGFGWHQTTVAKTESATRPIRVNELAALADVLGVEARLLLDDSDDEQTDEDRHDAERLAAWAEVQKARDEEARCREALALAHARADAAEAAWQKADEVVKADMRRLSDYVAEYVEPDLPLEP